MAGTAGFIPGKVVLKSTQVYAQARAWGENFWSGIARPKRRLMLAKPASPELRVFHLWRDEDPSGVSGIGRVAVGVVFPSGKVVLEWLGSSNTLGIYDDLKRVERIHGHEGKTRIVFTRNAVPLERYSFQRAINEDRS